MFATAGLGAADVGAVRAASGSIGDHGHEWDDDPAAWVREQRRDRVQD